MADADAFARFSRIARSALPRSPEDEVNPKRTMVQSWRASRHEELRSIAVASPVEMQVVGARTAEFVRDHWDPIRTAATGRAPSLARALRRLQELCG